MKRQTTFLIIISTLILSTSALLSNAQVYKSTNYYYNNFDGGQLGAQISQTSAEASLEVSNSSPIAGNYSLSSLSNGKLGSYKFSFIDNDTDLNKELEKNGWEWTFVYKNSGANPDDPSTISSNKNSWRYWLYASNSDLADMKGYYIAQKGSSIVISQRESANTTRDFFSYDLSQLGGNNVSYAIRVQRISKNGYAFRLFIDAYTSSKQEATTLRGESNSGNIDNYNRYNYSGLQVSSTTLGRFKFDEVKLYARKLEILGANSSANGLSTPLYNGQKDAVIYGLKFKTRGLFTEIYQIQTEIEQTGYASFADIVENPRLFRSKDDFFGNSDDVLIDKNQGGGAFSPSLNYRTLQANSFETQTFHSVGTTDGALLDAGSLFFKVDIKADASEKGTFYVKKLAFIGNNTANVNYVAEPNVVNGNTTTTPSALLNVYDWIGETTVWGTNTNWRLANNATPSAAPSTSDLVRIGVGKTFSKMPTLGSSTKIAGLTIAGSLGSAPVLTLNLGATLTVTGAFVNQRSSSISGNGTLTIEGNWNTSGGKINLTSGNVAVNFNGNKDQAIKDDSSDSGNGILFGNVGFSGGGTKTLNGKFAVAVGKYLTMGANTKLHTSDNLTLKASVEGSANVGTIPTTSAISGQVIVQKYVQGGNKDMWRTYRMWSSPVYDNRSDFVSANIVGGRTYNFTQFIDDVIITGKNGAANGFDINATNSASAWTYDNAYIAIPNINTSVNVGRGVYLYYRGDRSNFSGKVNSPYVDAESALITYKGVLNQQDITVPLVHGSTGFSLLGNPYAATIDWNAVTKTANVGAVVRIWNPGSRQYATFNGEFGVNGGKQYIGPGQAFFVQTMDNASPSVTFTESSKLNSASQSSPAYNVVMSVKDNTIGNAVMSVGQSYSQEVSAKIRVKLSKDNSENSDETLVVLKRSELATVAGYDVERSGGESVFLSSLSSEGKKMAINYMPHVSLVRSVKLGVDVSSDGAYVMSLTSNDIPMGYEAKLKDNYLNTVTDIFSSETAYNFSVLKSVAASYGDNRFEVLITPISTLPVTISEFTGNKSSAGVLLNWKTSSENNNSHFEVRKAGENQVYTSLGTVQSNSTGIYQILDKSPLNGNNYYQLVQVDNDGKSTVLPKMVALNYNLNDVSTKGITVYPTLVESTFTLKYTGSILANQYIVKITDATGKYVYSKQVDKSVILNGFTGELRDISSGVYFATLIDVSNGTKIGTAKIIKK